MDVLSNVSERLGATVRWSGITNDMQPVAVRYLQRQKAFSVAPQRQIIDCVVGCNCVVCKPVAGYGVSVAMHCSIMAMAA
jgi:hypothetical protein